jgi:hypothetical protein
MRFSYIQKMRHLGGQVQNNILPPQTMESFRLPRVVCNQKSGLSLSPLLKYICFVDRHFFKPYRTHVVSIAVVNICLTPTLKSLFKCIARRFRSMIHRDISLPLRFVHNSCLSPHPEVFTQFIEPLDKLAISRKVLKVDCVEGWFVS